MLVAPHPRRSAAARGHACPTRGSLVEAETVEVLGQRKLLKWTVPGIAHFFAFWGFIVLGLTILEAYCALIDPELSIPVIDQWAWVAFVEDFFAVVVLVALSCSRPSASSRTRTGVGRALALLRLAHRRRVARALHDLQRRLDAALLPRRPDQHRQLPVPRRPAPSPRSAVADVLEPLGEIANERIETVGVLLQIAVILGFLVHRRLQQAPAHLRWPRSTSRSRGVRTRSARCCRCTPADSRSTSRTRARTTSSDAARSRTSPGRACSTSRRAPSAAAASRSARRGTPASRCRRSCSS